MTRHWDILGSGEVVFSKDGRLKRESITIHQIGSTTDKMQMSYLKTRQSWLDDTSWQLDGGDLEIKLSRYSLHLLHKVLTEVLGGLDDPDEEPISETTRSFPPWKESNSRTWSGLAGGPKDSPQSLPGVS